MHATLCYILVMSLPSSTTATTTPFPVSPCIHAGTTLRSLPAGPPVCPVFSCIILWFKFAVMPSKYQHDCDNYYSMPLAYIPKTIDNCTVDQRECQMLCVSSSSVTVAQRKKPEGYIAIRCIWPHNNIVQRNGMKY